MKKKILLFLLFLILLGGVIAGWLFFAPATAFTGNKYILYIHTGSGYEKVIRQLETDQVLSSTSAFNWLAKRFEYPQNVKAGKYEIQKGDNLVAVIRMLRNGRQTPVNFTVTKLRTKEDFASSVGKHFECDSAEFIRFLNNADTVKTYGFDTSNVMTVLIPDTYTYFWNTTPSRIFKKLNAGSQSFWNEERKQQASAHKLTPVTAYILASIVEEETTRKEDKGKIASAYLNRIEKGMNLAADPTVKFAMRNFELKRIYRKYTQIESPYNTYLHPGLPPGPICTPSPVTLDAVLNAPQTGFLYFVAKPDLSGFSNFAEDYTQHLKYAKAYQHMLDSLYKDNNPSEKNKAN